MCQARRFQLVYSLVTSLVKNVRIVRATSYRLGNADIRLFWVEDLTKEVCISTRRCIPIIGVCDRTRLENIVETLFAVTHLPSAHI